MFCELAERQRENNMVSQTGLRKNVILQKCPSDANNTARSLDPTQTDMHGPRIRRKRDPAQIGGNRKAKPFWGEVNTPTNVNDFRCFFCKFYETLSLLKVMQNPIIFNEAFWGCGGNFGFWQRPGGQFGVLVASWGQFGGLAAS